MKVVLIKELEGYGTVGTVINVKDGFARNYLIPRGIALPATEPNLKHVQSILSQKQRKATEGKRKSPCIGKEVGRFGVGDQASGGRKGKTLWLCYQCGDRQSFGRKRN
jgi:large subunit ribosomal protein L9